MNRATPGLGAPNGAVVSEGVGSGAALVGGGRVTGTTDGSRGGTVVSEGGATVITGSALDEHELAVSSSA